MSSVIPKDFKVTNICPFDLMRWSRDATYDKLSEEYNRLFNKEIEILAADISFVKNGLKVVIRSCRQN